MARINSEGMPQIWSKPDMLERGPSSRDKEEQGTAGRPRLVKSSLPLTGAMGCDVGANRPDVDDDMDVSLPPKEVKAAAAAAS